MLRVLVSKPDSRPIKLLLEDGETFDGYSFGRLPTSPVIGEAVFNTGMVGYTEALTDPSYCGQLLCFTYPLLGNYGVPDYLKDSDGIIESFESDRIQVSGVIANQVSEEPSHFQSTRTLSQWMAQEGIPGIEGIDTRELTLRLQRNGVMMAAFGQSLSETRSSLSQAEDYSRITFYDRVSTSRIRRFGDNRNGRVALIDCGVKLNIVRSLVNRGLEVVIFPYDSNFEEVSSIRPDGAVFSNGPGDPKTCVAAVELAKNIIDASIPTLGICLGTQIIALSQGADTFKLKYGHRGQNKPCVDLRTGKCLVTSQNHGYSVLEESLEKTALVPWFVNADDKTIEGLIHEKRPCISVQFHPEASPGPIDAKYVFDIFLDLIRKNN